MLLLIGDEFLHEGFSIEEAGITFPLGDYLVEY